MKLSIRLLWSVLVLLALGCTSVKPWERSELLRRTMLPVLDPLESARDGHVHATREAIEGASLGGGASCGCN